MSGSRVVEKYRVGSALVADRNVPPCVDRLWLSVLVALITPLGALNPRENEKAEDGGKGNDSYQNYCKCLVSVAEPNAAGLFVDSQRHG